MLKIMTPGPTQVRENVRAARALPTTNPDLDLSFYDEYRDVCRDLAQFFHTENEFFLLSGEGILGLEAACASLIEPGDRVLVIDNGIFGRGFADFVKIYGGEPVLYSVDPQNPVDPDALTAFLERDHAFRAATLVHCDTPSGMLNDVETLSPLLKRYGILTIVDSVSASFGTPLDVSRAQIDILCGGSQKALSAPIGLTFLGVSADAFARMDARRKPIASFYLSILSYRDYYAKKWFPYSMPISDIYGFRAALQNVLDDPEIFARHARIARACREALTQGGLSLYLRAGFSPTVTVFDVPAGLTDTAILQKVAEQGVMLAGCFDTLAGRVIRIGHMGENANIEDMRLTMRALHNALTALGKPPCCNLEAAFLHALEA